MEESEEQLYWLQLLSDLGSNQPAAPSHSHFPSAAEDAPSSTTSKEPLESYMYLDLHHNDAVGSHEISYKNIVDSRHENAAPAQYHHPEATTQQGQGQPQSSDFMHHYYPSTDTSTATHQIDHAKDEPVVTERSISSHSKATHLYDVALAMERFSRLKKYTAPKKVDVWREEYPAAMELVKNDFIFNNDPVTSSSSPLEIDSKQVEETTSPYNQVDGDSAVVESEDTNDNDTIQDLPEQSIAIPNDLLVNKKFTRPGQYKLKSHLVNSVSQFASTSLQTSVTVAHDLTSSAAKTLNLVLQKVFEQLVQQMTQNFVVSSVIGCVSESSSFIADRTQTLASLYLHRITYDDPEQMRLEKIKNASSWEHVLLRYSMATLTWKQRQLLKETRDIDNKHDGDSMKEATSRKEVGNEASTKQEQFEKQNMKWMEEVKSNIHEMLCLEAEEMEDDDVQYVLARYFTAPGFSEGQQCCQCAKTFGLTLFRHHCRNCGGSVCEEHSKCRKSIYRYGFIQPVRVCDRCAFTIDEIHRMDELMWKDGRVRAFIEGNLIPYHQQHIDRGIDKAIRVADYSLLVAKNTLTLNFPTKVVFETIEVMQRYGLSGFAGLMLRNDVMESVETLKKIVGMDNMFQINLHELTACVYYKLAIERGLRGCFPECEADEHTPTSHHRFSCMDSEAEGNSSSSAPFSCKDAQDKDISTAIRFAPLALNIIYEEDPVDMQRLAMLQGLQLLYTNAEMDLETEQPCYGLFGVDRESSNQHGTKDVVLAIRGTQTIQDAVTDIRAIPQHFPPTLDFIVSCLQGGYRNGEGLDKTILQNHLLPKDRDEWLSGHCKDSYACGGMARAAIWILQEVGPSLLRLAHEGYKITIVGHSLGGAVAALLTCMLRAVLPQVSCVTFGCPACVDAFTADRLKPFVTTVVLHDDIVTRISPQSIRKLLREMMVFRSQIFRHLKQDWEDVIDRSLSVWAPRLRDAGEEEFAQQPTFPDVSSKSKEEEKYDAVMVEDEDLATLWIPGKILHLYFNKGRYLASEVSRDFPALRRIEVQGHMLDDHRGAHIMNALLEVRAVKKAHHDPPYWQPFNSSSTCACCKNRFTWHSTFRGEAQEYRERYNCRHCGALVCGPCSTQKRTIPKFGLIFPKRICDKCVLKGDYAHL